MLPGLQDGEDEPARPAEPVHQRVPQASVRQPRPGDAARPVCAAADDGPPCDGARGPNVQEDDALDCGPQVPVLARRQAARRRKRNLAKMNPRS